MHSSANLICFVVMGFGEKPDFESGRVLDLDATYEAIIEPTVTKMGIQCYRADEIKHSGYIDAPMYEMLLRADIVIADISTSNANAIYELGVRHALRPNSTIIMKESEGRFYFDLNHVNTFQYEHLGKDIGHREAHRARRVLESLIKSSLAAKKPDSPVYTFLPNLQQPHVSAKKFQKVLDDVEEANDTIVDLIKKGKQAREDSNFREAVRCFKNAVRLKPNDPFLIQQYALSTYKNKKPDEITALNEAFEILAPLDPNDTNDPETLGIAGAIQKRLWFLEKKMEHLDQAIMFYGRGYTLTKNYYNGENLALCHDYKRHNTTDNDRVAYHKISSYDIREEIVANLNDQLFQQTIEDRSDRKWVYATLSNCLLALGRFSEAETVKRQFYNQVPANWEIETFEKGWSEIETINNANAPFSASMR
ncbi:tetratricopeptide repeat-containing protein [Terasakiella sp.]|uniref:tetratricopeptide repeat-containing protein n=1 Tax=Terasakiella sp. TaxID=2034861 RepID=UPI003AA9887E